jgi:hypothetical protein
MLSGTGDPWVFTGILEPPSYTGCWMVDNTSYRWGETTGRSDTVRKIPQQRAPGSVSEINRDARRRAKVTFALGLRRIRD